MALPVAFLPLVTLLWIACRDAARLTEPSDGGAGLVVSDPAVVVPEALGGIAAARNVVGAAAAEVAYVSLPPGTITEATFATVHNISKSVEATVTVIDGGFDPIAIEAAAGDTIEVEPQGRVAESMALVVPVRRPPQIVRTSPKHGKRDVAFNERILVVFSEPLDRQSVDASAIQLRRAGLVVPGRVEIDETGLTLRFVPNAPLLPGTDYEIVVTDNPRDLDGDHLPSLVRADFTTAASPLSLQRIAFFDSRAMYVMNADGSDIQTLIVGESSTAFSVTHPAWAPDGSKIAFAASRDGNWDIYVMNADGSNVTRLTTDPALDVAPDWSRDGKQIAFTSTRGEGWRDIYVMDIDGTNVKRLTSDPASDNNPAWSPDGSEIAFSSDRVGGGDTEIYAMNADGSGITRLTFDPEHNDMPDWSPDGVMIAYHRYEPLGTGAVYVMSSNGAGQKRLTSGGGAPAWSPDARFIVYSGTFLYMMKADGTGAHKLTDVEAYEPAWSPR